MATRFPAARWYQWDPAGRDNARAGAPLAFGEYVDAQYRIDQADVIVATPDRAAVRRASEAVAVGDWTLDRLEPGQWREIPFKSIAGS